MPVAASEGYRLLFCPGGMLTKTVISNGGESCPAGTYAGCSGLVQWRCRSDRQRLQSGHAMYSLPRGPILGSWHPEQHEHVWIAQPDVQILTWTAQQDVVCDAGTYAGVGGTACDECVPGQIDHDSNASVRTNACRYRVAAS